MKRLVGLLSAVGITTATLVGAATPASAAEKYFYQGYAANTAVQVLGDVVRSDFTSAAGIAGTRLPAHNENSLASATVAGLATAKVLTTEANAARHVGGASATFDATVAKVSLLGGLITADAVETSTTASASADGYAGGSTTTLVRLRIAGTAIPVSVPNNTEIAIPGVASVLLNESVTEKSADGITVIGSAIRVRLLEGKVADVIINPTKASIGTGAYSRSIGGFGYVTRVDANVANTIEVESGPTARVTMPLGGTKGKLLRNSTLAVNLKPILEAGVIESSATGVVTPAVTSSDLTASVARLNVLNGLITADAIRARSTTTDENGVGVTQTGETEFVGLRIAGFPLTIKLNKNTKLNILGLGSITLNEQTVTPDGHYRTTGLRLVLSTARAGLPIGAEIEIAVAESWIEE